MLWGDKMGVSITLPTTADVDLARSLGFRWIRGGSECGWGESSLKQQLEVAAYAKERGVKFLWCSNLSGHTLVPSRLREWYDYHVAIAKVVRYFEIGNEWNNDNFIHNYDLTWRTQAVWHSFAALGIRSVRPGATIITSGLSPYGGDDGGINNRWPQVAAKVYLENIDPQYVDGIGNHPYESHNNPSSHWDNHPGWGACYRNRDVYFTQQPIRKPIWVTEFGSQSADFAIEEARAVHFEQYFAEFTAQRKAGLGFGALFVHTLRDGSSYIPGQETPTWGIVTADGKDKGRTTKVIRDQLAKTWV